MIKEGLVFLGLTFLVTLFLCFLRYFKKLLEYRAKALFGDLEVKKERIKGEIDHNSLRDLIKRNNERRK